MFLSLSSLAPIVCINSLWKISSDHCFIPRLDTWFRNSPRGQCVCVGITNPQCFPGSREMSSLSDCNLPNALIKSGKSLWFYPWCDPWPFTVLILGMTSVFFSRSPEEEWHVTPVYTMTVYLFLYLAVNFILLINKPTFSNHGASRGRSFHPPWFNLGTFGLEQHSVSIITFDQDLQGSGSVLMG